MALAIVVDAKKGMSANQLKEHLGIGSYRTAWYMAHRIRKAMEDNGSAGLKGIVEVDETYIGGKSKRRGGTARNQKPRNEKFDMVISMRERKGRVKFVHIPDGKAASIGSAVGKHIDLKVKRIYHRWCGSLRLCSASSLSPQASVRESQCPVDRTGNRHSHEHGRIVILALQARPDRELSSCFDKAPAPLPE